MKVARFQGTQTRLSLPRMTKFVKELKTLKRKNQRLQKRNEELKLQVSELRHEARKVEALIQKSNIKLLQVWNNTYFKPKLLRVA
ncbi:hypothetical protein HPB48_003440 [Haemaphysalis longicornis]|uniref:Uncharacterized protein n=1 Tax=Haemaphysalis longicornis TaxID=44386 RepID=A0A9J6GBW2_HAELO|nr:hypothetical protein HPB48_003440 [Haemaphysalis longicornis]